MAFGQPTWGNKLRLCNFFRYLPTAYRIAGNNRVVYPVDSAWRPADDEDQRIVLELGLQFLQLLRLTQRMFQRRWQDGYGSV